MEEPEERIEKTADVCGGSARIKGTRISVWLLEQYRRINYKDSEILIFYPSLNQEDLDAAWEYVKKHKKEIEKEIKENEEA